MRGYGPFLGLVLLVGCGDSSSAGGEGPGGAPASLDGCDGSGPEVGDGYPQLGPGCGSNFVYRTRGGLNDVDIASETSGPNGARPNAIGFEIGSAANDQSYALVLFLPSLAPGDYRSTDGAQAKSQIATTYGSAWKSGGVLISVAGASDDAVWGDFAASTCSYDFEPECFIEAGRFSAAIESTPSDGAYGEPAGVYEENALMCIVPEDCSAGLPACAVPACAEGGGLCELTPDDSLCGPNGSCTPDGCVDPP